MTSYMYSFTVNIHLRATYFANRQIQLQRSRSGLSKQKLGLHVLLLLLHHCCYLSVNNCIAVNTAHPMGHVRKDPAFVLGVPFHLCTFEL